MTDVQAGGEPSPGSPPNSTSRALSVLAVTLLFNSLALVYGFHSFARFQDEVRWMMAFVIPARAAAATRPVPAQTARTLQTAAPVTVMVYWSFACPFCRASAAALDSVRREVGGQVAWEYKFLSKPESVDPLAWRAALAGVCSEGTDRLWDFSLRLSRRPWTRRSIELTISEIGGDSVGFKECMGSNASEARIWGDIFDAARLGIHETPTIDVDGIRVTGQLSAAPLIALVREREAQHALHETGPDRPASSSFR
jgi:protein-disulfide isomerase